MAAHRPPLADAQLVTPLDGPFLAWRYGFEDLHYRALSIEDAVAFFRVRRRGRATECVIGHVLGPDPAARRRVIREVARRVRADRTLALDDAAGFGQGFVRAYAVGPTLMWRGLRDPRMPSLEKWALTLGDVELF